MKIKYLVSDGNAQVYADCIKEAANLVEDWYDYLKDDGRIESEDFPLANLNSFDVDELNYSIGQWENQIAEQLGHKDFAGHGNYFVSARDSAGLNLCVTEIKELEEFRFVNGNDGGNGSDVDVEEDGSAIVSIIRVPKNDDRWWEIKTSDFEEGCRIARECFNLGYPPDGYDIHDSYNSESI